MKFKTLLSLSELFWNIFKDILVLLFLAIFVFVSRVVMIFLRLINKILKITGVKKRLMQ
ncbi:hypothetical protein [Francisella philomiragia]|uniref:Uncharacterized protein n=1 Tax=Francisella philomiragia TaxID=28110 RepID=A0AAW3DA35_9GAMM|nr:hypothetical protein [Francisella philomiragia]AJI46835.1 hypothetical protein BF30_1489 [Francisella philomiragia]AJI49150.1 hypothetical protein KU46_70 [Francisella philomiragia]AJI55387.1 hypothetical protein LA56_948 [Francisella philomiragia]AJI75157.1 hypothetical protein BZ13_762 [Francisella philomiragia subsp. philomiragia ATCC 25015]EET21007.1 predicted protein [Francisella philomiragia subsp. philomiragia ATCC 25015]